VQSKTWVTFSRQTPGGCEILSVVGPRYAPLDIDVIATQVHQIVAKDARAEVLNDGYRARSRSSSSGTV